MCAQILHSALTHFAHACGGGRYTYTQRTFWNTLTLSLLPRPYVGAPSWSRSVGSSSEHAAVHPCTSGGWLSPVPGAQRTTMIFHYSITPVLLKLSEQYQEFSRMSFSLWVLLLLGIFLKWTCRWESVLCDGRSWDRCPLHHDPPEEPHPPCPAPYCYATVTHSEVGCLSMNSSGPPTL